MRSLTRRSVALAATTCAVAVAAPASGASAAVFPVAGFPAAAAAVPGAGLGGGVFIGGNAVGSTMCIGTNRPSFGGNTGSTANTNCASPGPNGPQLGQISSIVGPSVLNSGFVPTQTSNGTITNAY